MQRHEHALLVGKVDELTPLDPGRAQAHRRAPRVRCGQDCAPAEMATSSDTSFRSSRRAGLACVNANCAAAPQAGVDRMGVRTIRAVHEHVDPEHADDRIDRARPVGRDFEEGVLVDRGRARPSARGTAPDAAARVRRASRSTPEAVGTEAGRTAGTRTRRRASAARSRRVPATSRERPGPVGMVPAGRARVHEQGPVALPRARQQRRDALVPRTVEERGRRQTADRRNRARAGARATPGSTAVRLAAAHARNGRGSASAPS